MKTESTTITPFIWVRAGLILLCGSLLSLGLSDFSPERRVHSDLTPMSSLPLAHPVNLSAEISDPMFRGTVQTIDRDSLWITIQTDFGRVVALPVSSCDVVDSLQVGDHVPLEVDTQGIVREVEKMTASPAPPFNNSLLQPLRSGSCPESRT